MSSCMLSRFRAAARVAVLIVAVLTVLPGCSPDSIVGSGKHPLSAAVGSEPNYSFSISPVDRTVRVRFTRVRGDGRESVSTFMKRVFVSADAAGARRLVLDLSATKGGDSFLSVPLLKGVLAREQFAKRGGLVVIVGPDSFSGAQSIATLLQRYAQPIFVSSPIG
jgi:hypothetical protein